MLLVLAFLIRVMFFSRMSLPIPDAWYGPSIPKLSVSTFEEVFLVGYAEVMTLGVN